MRQPTIHTVAKCPTIDPSQLRDPAAEKDHVHFDNSLAHRIVSSDWPALLVQQYGLVRTSTHPTSC